MNPQLCVCVCVCVCERERERGLPGVLDLLFTAFLFNVQSLLLRIIQSIQTCAIEIHIVFVVMIIVVVVVLLIVNIKIMPKTHPSFSVGHNAHYISEPQEGWQ